MKNLSYHPVNLAFRFILELAALFSMAFWGWHQHTEIARYLWAIGLPLVSAFIWGTFAVPDDPSRSGQAPIPIVGSIRLLLEWAFFTLGVLCLFGAGQTTWGWVLLIFTILHYLVSYERILWLLKQ